MCCLDRETENLPRHSTHLASLCCPSRVSGSSGGRRRCRRVKRHFRIFLGGRGWWRRVRAGRCWCCLIRVLGPVSDRVRQRSHFGDKAGSEQGGCGGAAEPDFGSVNEGSSRQNPTRLRRPTEGGVFIVAQHLQLSAPRRWRVDSTHWSNHGPAPEVSSAVEVYSSHKC